MNPLQTKGFLHWRPSFFTLRHVSIASTKLAVLLGLATPIGLSMQQGMQQEERIEAMTDTVQPPTADLLYGVPAISEFLGITAAAVYHLAAKKRIPTFKVGKTVCARRARILEAFEQLEQSAAA
jgi:hypothetical protein